MIYIYILMLLCSYQHRLVKHLILTHAVSLFRYVIPLKHSFHEPILSSKHSPVMDVVCYTFSLKPVTVTQSSRDGQWEIYWLCQCLLVESSSFFKTLVWGIIWSEAHSCVFNMISLCPAASYQALHLVPMTTSWETGRWKSGGGRGKKIKSANDSYFCTLLKIKEHTIA